MKNSLEKKFVASVLFLSVCVGATCSYAAPLWDDGGARKIYNGITLQKDNKSKDINGTKKKEEIPITSIENKSANTVDVKKNNPVKPNENNNQQMKSNSSSQKEKKAGLSEDNDYRSSYAKEAIDYAIRKGYVDVGQSGKFFPQKNIQRYEFIYMVNRAFGFDKKKEIHFLDVSKSDFYYTDVSVAMGAGYMYTFNGNTIFGPKKYFYRWELPYILGKAMKKDFSTEETKTLMNYSDGSKVPISARTSVAYFIQKGWMNPKSKNKFGTHDILTKEETAYVLYQLQKAGYLK